MTESNHDILLRYEQARAFFIKCRGVLNISIEPVWIGHSDHFWYKRELRIGKEFRLVDATTQTSKPAFDHKLLAQALERVTHKNVPCDDLPINIIEIELKPRRVLFSAFAASWLFDSETGDIARASNQNKSEYLISPDGKKAVFIRDHNIWLRDIEAGKERALTSDGESHNAYGENELVRTYGRMPWNAPLEAQWSPDSRKIFTLKRDSRGLEPLVVLDYLPPGGGSKPRNLPSMRMPYREDITPSLSLKVINIESDELIKVNELALPETHDSAILGFFQSEECRGSWDRGWWGKDSKNIYFLVVDAGIQHVNLKKYDIETGQTRTLFEEVSDTYVRGRSDVESGWTAIPLLETEELIWYSERSGWGHLYLYDLKTGGVKNAITSGDWVVRDVLHVDQDRRELIIATSGRVEGRDLYFRDIVRVNMDTKELTPLVSSNHEYVTHALTLSVAETHKTNGEIIPNVRGVSFTGNFIVTNRSRVDDAPVSLLINREGEILMTLETADLSALPQYWSAPERVKTTAADGETEIYGVIYTPHDFDPSRKYPVLEYHYSNPAYNYVPKAFPGPYDHLSRLTVCGAYAAVGFVVVMLDGKGGANRSKAFRDASYGFWTDASLLEDRVEGIRQLSKERPWMDLSRVGVAAVRGPGPLYALLQYPDFYKVGVLFGMHDGPSRSTLFTNPYEGVMPPPNIEKRWYEIFGQSLKGKLLLIHGLRDEFNTPTSYFRVINSLIDANKNFDMLVMPKDAAYLSPYAERRRMDYLVRNLMEVEPPYEFDFTDITQPQIVPGLDFGEETASDE